MNGFFITGTDTGVGKTALSALLLAEFRRRGINAAPMKPVQTGCEVKSSEFRVSSSEFATSLPRVAAASAFGGQVPDLDYSLSMAGMTVSEEDYKNMAPYCFEPACSPHLAAELAGTEIEISRIVSAAQKLAEDYDTLIVEGAGGVLVPLNRKDLMLDLMKALQLPVILAARPGLGTINHTLLSLRALREAQLEIAGIVFISGSDTAPGFIEKDNAGTIEQFGGVPILGTIPYCELLKPPAPDYNSLPIPVVAEVEKIVMGLQKIRMRHSAVILKEKKYEC